MPRDSPVLKAVDQTSLQARWPVTDGVLERSTHVKGWPSNLGGPRLSSVGGSADLDRREIRRRGPLNGCECPASANKPQR